MKKYVLFYFLLLLLGCATPIPIPKERDITFARHRWPETSAKDLHAGRKLYIERCSGCHSVKPPVLYSEAQWTIILPEMEQKAKLHDDEARLLKKYLITITNQESSDSTQLH